MTTPTHQRMSISSVLAWTGVLAIVWLVAAIARDNTTLHLGPLLLPIVAAVLARGTNHSLGLTAIGSATGAVIIALLAVTNNLEGPGLGPFSDAPSESMALLGIGTIVGAAVARSARPRTA